MENRQEPETLHSVNEPDADIFEAWLGEEPPEIKAVLDGLTCSIYGDLKE